MPRRAVGQGELEGRGVHADHHTGHHVAVESHLDAVARGEETSEVASGGDLGGHLPSTEADEQRGRGGEAEEQRPGRAR